MRIVYCVCLACLLENFDNMLSHSAGPSSASSQSQPIHHYQGHCLIVTRKRSKENEKDHFNELGMAHFLGWSILKTVTHVFVMRAEYLPKTLLKRKRLL